MTIQSVYKYINMTMKKYPINAMLAKLLVNVSELKITYPNLNNTYFKYLKKNI